MKELEKFIEEHDIDKSLNVIDEILLKDAQNQINIIFGPELKNYILSYGYLGFDYVEFYGINSNQKLESDLIVQTEYLHKYYPFTKDYIAFENLEEGNFIVIDSNDKIYLCDTRECKIYPKNMNLNNYILSRFNMVL